jgi:uncharacterized delta-60 repeat protein
MKKITLTSAILYFTFCICHAQSTGSLDNTFGTSGIVSTGFGGIYETAESVVIQSDGKIVVAGSSGRESPRIGVIAIARYNTSDGSLDNTFGVGGIVNTRFVDGNFYYGHSIALQSDGKMVVAGHRADTLTGTVFSFVVARYNSDGSLDNVWGNLSGTAQSVALQSDGKIVVVGTSGSGIGLIRYNTNSSYDATFGSGGIVTTTVGTNCGGNSVAIQSDGKIVVAGGNGNIVVVRYNGDGSLDNTFGSGGIVTTDFGSSSDDGRSIAVQSDGKIVVAGRSDNGTLGVVALARYNSNGSLDTAFGTGGKVTTFDGSDGMSGNSVVIQSDGKIVVAGNKGDNSTPGLGQSDFALLRYDSNGNLDNTFGTGGIATTHIYVGDDVLSAAIQGDGKIVAAGYTAYTDGPYWEVARFNNTVFTGIEEPSISDELDLKIFPNPSSRIISLSVKNKTAKTKIYVTDALGNCLLNKVCQNETNPTIDLVDQPKGIYFMEIVSDNERVVKKIVLE